MDWPATSLLLRRLRRSLPWRARAQSQAPFRDRPQVNATHTAEVHPNTAHHSAPAHISWARLLKRVFDIDIEHCRHCGGTLKIIAAIENPAVIAKILTHLGLSARAPPRTPAQAFDRFQVA